ncbi:MAG: hypothetical protein HY904_21120 [Deltaproteobacteria bacterium]|nr:hypothetical protein [Deltaproteobacteria bacterium]
MLSVEVIDALRREEEQRREEAERSIVRVPVDRPEEQERPREEAAASEQPSRGVLVLDMSRDDTEEFRIASW